MAYTINKTDGSVVATITDGTIDNSTSLTLFGKSYSGFGELLNENLLKLLENSASTAQPTAPLTGELWFDTTTAINLKVYDGTSFKPTGGAKSQSTAPTSASAGDLWVDTDDNQLYLYTGSVHGCWQDQFMHQDKHYQDGKLKHLEVQEETKLFLQCMQEILELQYFQEKHLHHNITNRICFNL